MDGFMGAVAGFSGFLSADLTMDAQLLCQFQRQLITWVQGADTRWCSGQDQVTWQQGEVLTDRGRQLQHRPDHQAAMPRLT